jgi:myosin heavy subunit
MKHFAGDVTYCVDGWLEKNNDKLSDDYEKMFTSSAKQIMAEQLAKKEEEEEPAGGGGKGRARKGKGGQTVSRGFLTSLKKLMEALESTEAHFIRCIKPNNEVCAEVVSPRLRQPRTSSSDAPTGRPRC